MLLSPVKIMVIVAVVLLLLGPDKLPEVAHRLGSSWRAIKRLQERVESEVREALPDLPSTGDIARMARSPLNLLNQLADQVDAKEAGTSSNAGGHDESPAIDNESLISPMPYRVPVSRIEGPTPPPDPSLN